jgi:hypothetical protein
MFSPTCHLGFFVYPAAVARPAGAVRPSEVWLKSWFCTMSDA